MFVKYVTNNTSVLAQVIADMALLASGSPLSALSASCDKVNSQVIASTDNAGWTIHDAAGPSSGKVLTAKDASNTDKFLGIIPIANGFYTGIFDTYNLATHTGTNLVAANTSLLWSGTLVNTYFMLVNQKRMIIADSTSASVIGSIEFAREHDAFNNLAYPAHANIGYITNNASNVLTFAKFKKQNGVGDMLASSGGQNSGGFFTIAGIDSGLRCTQGFRDAGDAMYLPMLPIYIGYTLSGVGAFPFGKVDDTYVTSNTAGNGFDTAVVGSDTYVVFVISTVRILFKLG